MRFTIIAASSLLILSTSAAPITNNVEARDLAAIQAANGPNAMWGLHGRDAESKIIDESVGWGLKLRDAESKIIDESVGWGLKLRDAKAKPDALHERNLEDTIIDESLGAGTPHWGLHGRDAGAKPDAEILSE